MLVGDAFSAAAAGMKPKMWGGAKRTGVATDMSSDQQDVDAAGEWLTVVERKLPPSSFKCLAVSLMSSCQLPWANRL
jgi:hypothetical protein